MRRHYLIIQFNKQGDIEEIDTSIVTSDRKMESWLDGTCFVYTFIMYINEQEYEEINSSIRIGRANWDFINCEIFVNRYPEIINKAKKERTEAFRKIFNF